MGVTQHSVSDSYEVKTEQFSRRAQYRVKEATESQRGRGADATEGSSKVVSLGSRWDRQIWKPDERVWGVGGQGAD